MPVQKLYETYKNQGLVILDFPCNQFGAQAPGSFHDIHTFCTGNYGTTFPQFAKIENAVLSALENTPPELYADIVKNGIYLSGGGALLRGIDKRLTDKINIPFHIAEDPLHSVAKGAGIALKNVDRFSFLMR